MQGILLLLFQMLTCMINKNQEVKCHFKKSYSQIRRKEEKKEEDNRIQYLSLSHKLHHMSMMNSFNNLKSIFN